MSLKQQWIDALRSGKYKQGRMKLYDDGQYCCLGVLAKVANAPVNLNRTFIHHWWWNEHFTGVAQDTLSFMNDEDGSPFTYIADYLEQHLEEKECFKTW